MDNHLKSVVDEIFLQLDGECTLAVWQMAIDIVKRYVPDRGATILDYCGGTGQVGKRVRCNYDSKRQSESIFFSWRIVITTAAFTSATAMALSSHKRCNTTRTRSYSPKRSILTGQRRFFKTPVCIKLISLREIALIADARYDCVLSLMSYAASQPVYEQMMRKSIKPGGYLISIDAQSHISKNERMAGVQWLLLEASLSTFSINVIDTAQGARQDGIEVIEHKIHVQCIDIPRDSIHVIVARRSL